ncbi:MAG: UDP-glucose/GDP-mannose dehydrogenase family protein [Fimbriimonadaceae bacterium]
MKVAVVGTGYVGLPTGVVLADLGHDVVCIDRDEAKLERIHRGESPIYEPGLKEVLHKVLKTGRFRTSASIAEGVKGAEIVFIAVGTPQGPDGHPDLSQVIGAAEEIGRCVTGPVIVVNKSTVPIGSGDLVERTILQQGADPQFVDVVSNPEFLREGSAIKDSYNPDRIVIGAKRKEAAEKLAALYKGMDCPVFVTDVHSSEVIKYASNSFLATKISFINAVSRMCELCDADVAAVAEGMGLDRRIGREFLKAGLGWGGSCFPKDVTALIAQSKDLGYDFSILRASSQVNDDQVRHFMSRGEKLLGGLKGKTVALLGLSFKPNTDDIRDAKSLEIIRLLLEKGASVRAHDPVAIPAAKAIFPNVSFCHDPYETASGADALILVTEWGEYAALDLTRLASVMRRAVLLDGRRLFDPRSAEAAGFTYVRVGSKGPPEQTE